MRSSRPVAVRPGGITSDDQQITEPPTLSALVPLSYDDELFSDYLAAQLGIR